MGIISCTQTIAPVKHHPRGIISHFVRRGYGFSPIIGFPAVFGPWEGRSMANERGQELYYENTVIKITSTEVTTDVPIYLD